jgi:hypothetical protein
VLQLSGGRIRKPSESLKSVADAAIVVAAVGFLAKGALPQEIESENGV